MIRESLRYIKYGQWGALWQRLRCSQRTFKGTINPYAHTPLEEVEVHVVTGQRQWVMCLWMLASWFRATQRNWRVVLHDDGTLKGEAEKYLRKEGVSATVIFRWQSDDCTAEALKFYPYCLRHRSISPHALKLYDPRVTTKSRKYIVLDTDILFFDEPSELLGWVDGKKAGCWFMRDVAEASQVTRKEAMDLFRIDLWRQVNSGVCLVSRNAIRFVDIEYFLMKSEMLERNLWMVEQTLYALCGSKENLGGILSEDYQLTLHTSLVNSSCMRHYVGAVRHEFFAEGVRRLRRAWDKP